MDKKKLNGRQKNSKVRMKSIDDTLTRLTVGVRRFVKESKKANVLLSKYIKELKGMRNG